MNRYIRELLLWVLIALPYGYLAYIWNGLPGRVPTHFNVNGQADDWSGKSLLLAIPAGLGLGIYLVMLFIPVFDPKKKLRLMGDKYHSLRFMMTFFISALSIYLLYITKVGQIKNPQWIIALLGLMLAMLGNYFQVLRPNYFVGIRTPWTLENEEVWRKTHFLGGRLWMAGGILIVIISFIIRSHVSLLITAGGILLVLVVVPVTFSFIEFRRQTHAG
jgi:uncharacterized membrane protein